MSPIWHRGDTTSRGTYDNPLAIGGVDDDASFSAAVREATLGMGLPARAVPLVRACCSIADALLKAWLW